MVVDDRSGIQLFDNYVDGGCALLVVCSVARTLDIGRWPRGMTRFGQTNCSSIFGDVEYLLCGILGNNKRPTTTTSFLRRCVTAKVGRVGNRSETVW